jgi:hypothetical protein
LTPNNQEAEAGGRTRVREKRVRELERKIETIEVKHKRVVAQLKARVADLEAAVAKLKELEGGRLLEKNEVMALAGT